MALYEVVRTDRPKGGEFAEGFVIAFSAKAARGAVAHLPGVTSKNVEARLVLTVGAVRVLSTYDAETDY